MGFVLNYLGNLAALAAGRQPRRPLLFSYYITHRCPWDCVYCSDGAGRPFKEEPLPELTGGEALRLLRILRAAGDTLNITGGEPMIREDLEEILAAARAMGLRTVLNTKGIGLADRPRLVELSDFLVLSVDALDEEVLSTVMGGHRAAARGVLAGLDFALAARRRSGTRLALGAVATPDNLGQAAKVLRFALERRLGFQLSPQIVGREVHPALRANAAYRELVDEVLQAKARGAAILGVKQYYQGIVSFASFRCHPLLIPAIRPDGTMYYPCLERGRAEVDLLEAGGYEPALARSRELCGPVPDCGDRCHLFCHLAISQLQRHPLAALREPRNWND